MYDMPAANDVAVGTLAHDACRRHHAPTNRRRSSPIARADERYHYVRARGVLLQVEPTSPVGRQVNIQRGQRGARFGQRAGSDQRKRRERLAQHIGQRDVDW